MLSSHCNSARRYTSEGWLFNLSTNTLGTSSIPLFVRPANKNVILALVEGNGKIKRKKERKVFQLFLAYAAAGRDISYEKQRRLPTKFSFVILVSHPFYLADWPINNTFPPLWRLLLIITVYYQTMTSIGFLVYAGIEP